MRAFLYNARIQDELIALLARFIAFRTTEPLQKRACLHWAKKEFFGSTKLKLEEGDVYGSPYLHLRHPSPKALLFAHVDVVPGRDDQFELQVNGDKAFGRGVKDMKGSTLTFLIAYRDACKSGNVPPVSILLTSDEETGGRAPPALLSQNMFDGVPIAMTPDNGGGDYIVVELKGGVWAHLIAHGSAGHGAMPWASRNPVPVLVDAIRSIADAFPGGNKDDWIVTVTPTQLKGSDAFNRVPSEARCILDIRYPPSICATSEDALELVRKHLPTGCALEKSHDAAPLFTDRAHPIVELVHRLSEEVIGKTIPIGRDHGSSDARSFTQHGIPAFVYGPVGGDLHGEGEWVSLQSLAEYTDMHGRLFAEL